MAVNRSRKAMAARRRKRRMNRVEHDLSDELGRAQSGQIVTPAARPVVNRIVQNCIQNPAQILASVPAASPLNVTFLRNPPWDTEPWRAILAETHQATHPPTLRFSSPRARPIRSCRLPCSSSSSTGCVRQAPRSTTAHTPAWGTSRSHTTPPPDVTQRIADRFAGTPAPSNCPRSMLGPFGSTMPPSTSGRIVRTGGESPSRGGPTR
jgi:hypothetical protein